MFISPPKTNKYCTYTIKHRKRKGGNSTPNRSKFARKSAVKRRKSMIYVSILLLILTILSAAKGMKSCPKKCRCSGNAVTCNNRSLKLVPKGIPKTTTHLSLIHNILTEEDLEQIHEFKKLAYLDLRYNEIEHLEDMKKLTRLEVIRLDYNRIKSIKANTIKKLPTRLISISLSNNRITGNIEPFTFTYFHKLVQLDLSNNQISAVSDSHIFPAQLEQLNISYNPITKIYRTTFQGMNKLETADMYELQLPSMLSSYFEDCSSLKELKIGGKALTAVSSSTFLGTKSLVRLDLIDTCIAQLPTQAFRESPNLTYLDISKNPLKDIEKDAFAGLQLKYLFLNENEDDLDLDFFETNNFSSLEQLYLRANKLTLFPFYLGSLLPSLIIFDLSGNELMDVEAGPFPSLSALNLSRNEIEFIPEDFFSNFPSLSSVDLSYNQLTELLPDWWVAHPRLAEIYAFENAWSCRCDIENVTNAFRNISFPCRIETTAVTYVLAKRDPKEHCIVCSSPRMYEGMSLVETMKNSTQTCQEMRTGKRGLRIATLACAVAILIVLVITSAVILKKRSEMERTESTNKLKKSTQASQTMGVITTDGNAGKVENDNSFHPYHTIGDTNSNMIGKYINPMPKAAAATSELVGPEADGVYSECRAATVGSRDREHSYIVANEHLLDLLKKPAHKPGSNLYGFIQDTDYQNLPRPPTPPNGGKQITVAGNKSDMESQYEPMRNIKRPSYIDFCHPETLLKLANERKDSSASARHTYVRTGIEWNKSGLPIF